MHLSEVSKEFLETNLRRTLLKYETTQTVANLKEIIENPHRLKNLHMALHLDISEESLKSALSAVVSKYPEAAQSEKPTPNLPIDDYHH